MKTNLKMQEFNQEDHENIFNNKTRLFGSEHFLSYDIPDIIRCKSSEKNDNSFMNHV